MSGPLLVHLDGVGRGHIHLGGTDITRHVSKLVLSAEAGQLPRSVLEAHTSEGLRAIVEAGAVVQHRDLELLERARDALVDYLGQLQELKPGAVFNFGNGVVRDLTAVLRASHQGGGDE